MATSANVRPSGTQAGSNLPRQPLRVLIVEDSSADAELITETLKRAGYSPAFDIVDSAEQCLQRLQRIDYDVILSDHNLLTWTGMDALKILQRSGKAIPFIVVTATLGDEAAVDYIKRGASDYVLKSRLERLPFVVGRALQDYALRELTAQLQEQILLEKRSWELTFDAVPDTLVVLSESGRVERANRAGIETLGFREDSEILGKSCMEIVYGRESGPPECTHCPLRPSGKAERQQIEQPHLGKTFDGTCLPLRDSTGAIRSNVLALRDVTECKRTESALRSSEEKYRSIVETAYEGIWMLDPEGQTIFANRRMAQMLGCTEEELNRLSVFDFIYPSDLPEAHARFKRYQHEAAVQYEVRYRRKDGCELWTLVNFSIARDETGQFVGALGMLTDITERKRLEGQFRQAQKMEAVGRLAGGVAHDFNNMLSIILGYALLMEERLQPQDPLRRMLEQIRKAGDRGASLTRQLLAFSRKQVLQPKVLDLNVVVAETEKMLRRLIGEDIEVVLELDPALKSVKADQVQLEQVIMNLAVNARDAMPYGGKLLISTANADLDDSTADVRPWIPSGRYVRLTVNDTGIGMDCETQSHLFEPFFTTKEVGKGTGLGLATVYGTITQNGGYISFYSEPGMGTTFKIYLPRVEEIAENQRLPHVEVAPVNGHETILIAEDEHDLRALTHEFLSRGGYTLLDAKDGQEAMAIAANHPGPIDLLLTDVVMPGMSGLELFKRLTETRPGIRVLYVSGYPDAEPNQYGSLGAGSAFLEKPFSRKDLLRSVRQLLDASPGIGSEEGQFRARG